MRRPGLSHPASEAGAQDRGTQGDVLRSVSRNRSLARTLWRPAPVPMAAAFAVGEEISAIAASRRQVIRGVAASSLLGEAGFWDAGLEQLDGISGGILEKDLLPTHPVNDFVAEMNTVLSEQSDPVGDVGDLNEESVPSPWFGPCAVRHCLPAAAPTAWCAEDKPQLATIQHCKSRGWVHYLVKVRKWPAAVEFGGLAKTNKAGYTFLPVLGVSIPAASRVWRGRRCRRTGADQVLLGWRSSKPSASPTLVRTNTCHSKIDRP